MDSQVKFFSGKKEIKRLVVDRENILVSKMRCLN